MESTPVDRADARRVMTLDPQERDDMLRAVAALEGIAEDAGLRSRVFLRETAALWRGRFLADDDALERQHVV